MGIAAAPVAFPNRPWGLAPVDVARAQVEPVVDAIATVSPASLSGEGFHRMEILPQDPDLQHAARLAIGRPFVEPGHDADERGAVHGAGAFPQDAAIQVGFSHRVLSAN